MSQSLVARAVPRALDPYSTTASIPGIEPTASTAVRLRRSWVATFIDMYPMGGARDRSARRGHAHSERWNREWTCALGVEWTLWDSRRPVVSTRTADFLQN